MELEALLAERRSTRRFDPDRDVPNEVLERILRAPLAMPHACNTYDWRGIVLRRAERDDRWPAVFDAVFRQSYLEEAPVVVVWAVQPRWWAAHYRENIDELVRRGLLDMTRAGDLLDLLEGGPDRHLQMTGALVGEAMMGVTAAMLAALDAGLGATLSACRLADMAKALDLPADAKIAPFGVLAMGYAVEVPKGSAPKSALSEVYYRGRWNAARLARGSCASALRPSRRCCTGRWRWPGEVASPPAGRRRSMRHTG